MVSGQHLGGFIIQKALEEFCDIDAIAQSIVCGGISLDEMGKKGFGKSLGVRIILEEWHGSSDSQSGILDVIIAGSLDFAASCLDETRDHTNLQLLASVEEWINQEHTLTVIDRDVQRKQEELTRVVDDLVQRRVVTGIEWEDKEIWRKKVHRIHESVYHGMEAGVRSLVNGDDFVPTHRHFFANFNNPLAFIIAAYPDAEQFVQESGLSVTSDFILRGGLRGIEREMKKREKSNKRKEVLRLRGGLDESSQLLQLEDVEGARAER
jgi:hypothetical protein